MASSGTVSYRGSGVAPSSERGRLCGVYTLAADPIRWPQAVSFPGSFLESALSLHSGPFQLGLFSGSSDDSIQVPFPRDVSETPADTLVMLSSPGSRAELRFPMNFADPGLAHGSRGFRGLRASQTLKMNCESNICLEAVDG